MSIVGRLSEEQLITLDFHLQDHLYLPSPPVGDYLLEAFGVDYSDAGETAILHRPGYVYKKVKPGPGKAEKLKPVDQLYI